MVVSFTIKLMVPCLIGGGVGHVAHIIIVAQEPVVVFVVFAVVSVITLGSYSLFQRSVSSIISHRVHHTFWLMACHIFLLGD